MTVAAMTRNLGRSFEASRVSTRIAKSSAQTGPRVLNLVLYWTSICNGNGCASPQPWKDMEMPSASTISRIRIIIFLKAKVKSKSAMLSPGRDPFLVRLMSLESFSLNHVEFRLSATCCFRNSGTPAVSIAVAPCSSAANSWKASCGRSKVLNSLVVVSSRGPSLTMC